MKTVDEIIVRAPLTHCFEAGADVEEWPEALPHYRWVRFQRKDDFGTGRIEMAARRQFGPLPYPVWWVSEMTVDNEQPAVRYLHVEGITTGMEVIWSFEALDSTTTGIKIVHSWGTGPGWPLPAFLCRLIADVIIGPIFIRHVAGRTLTGIRIKAERLYARSVGVEK